MDANGCNEAGKPDSDLSGATGPDWGGWDPLREMSAWRLFLDRLVGLGEPRSLALLFAIAALGWVGGRASDASAVIVIGLLIALLGTSSQLLKVLTNAKVAEADADASAQFGDGGVRPPAA